MNVGLVDIMDKLISEVCIFWVVRHVFVFTPANNGKLSIDIISVVIIHIARQVVKGQDVDSSLLK